MFRIIFWLLGLVLMISFIRGVIGIVLKGFSGIVNPQPSPRGPVPLTGELKKDPACGTYISAATSIHENVGGEIFYFCSAQCRDKYVASLAR